MCGGGGGQLTAAAARQIAHSSRDAFVGRVSEILPFPPLIRAVYLLYQKAVLPVAMRTALVEGVFHLFREILPEGVDCGTPGSKRVLCHARGGVTQEPQPAQRTWCLFTNCFPRRA